MRLRFAKMRLYAERLEGIRLHAGKCFGCDICSPPYSRSIWKTPEGRRQWLESRGEP